MDNNRPYKICYNLENRCICVQCRRNIGRGFVKISIVNNFNGNNRQHEWYHQNCFLRVRRPSCLDDFDGFNQLERRHQCDLREHLGFNRRTVSGGDAHNGSEADEFLCGESNKYAHLFEKIDKNITKDDQVSLLEFNSQYVPLRDYKIVHHLTDIFCNGALKPCKLCGKGIMYLQSNYLCTNKYTLKNNGCSFNTKKPERQTTKISQEFSIKYPFLMNDNITIFCNQSNEENIPKNVPNKILSNMEFLIIDAKKSREEIEKQIIDLGGKITTKLSANVVAIISSSEKIKEMEFLMQQAKSLEIPVITKETLNEFRTKDPITCIINGNISNWGNDKYHENQTENNDVKPSPQNVKDNHDEEVQSKNQKNEQNASNYEPKPDIFKLDCNSIQFNKDAFVMNKESPSSIASMVTNTVSKFDDILQKFEEMKSVYGFCQDYDKIEDDCMNNLKDYFNGLNNTMVKIKSMLDKSNTEHTEVNAIFDYSKYLQKLVNDGAQLMKDENYYEAIHFYTGALKISPLNKLIAFDFSQNSALANFKIGNFHDAIKDCNNALSLDINSNDLDVDVREIRAQCYYYLENFEFSMEDYEFLYSHPKIQGDSAKLAEIKENFESAKIGVKRKQSDWNNLCGGNEFASKHYCSAGNFYTAAINLYPNNIVYYEKRCKCFIECGEYKKALCDGQHVIAMNNQYLKVYEHLIKCYLIYGNFSEADQAIRKLENNQLYNDIYNEQKNLCIKLRKCDSQCTQNILNGQYNEAIVNVDQGLRFMPDSIHFTLLKAECLMHLGNLEEIKELEKTWNLTNADKFYLKSLCFYYNEQYEEAISHLKSGLKTDPDHQYSKQLKTKLENIQKGHNFFVQKKFFELINCYDKAYECNGKIIDKIANDILKNRVVAHTKLGNFRDSILECSKALKVQSNNLEIMLLRAECYICVDNYDCAIKDYELALQNETLTNENQRETISLKLNKIKEAYTKDNANKKNSIADGKMKAKKYYEALTFYSQAIDLLPKNMGFYRNRANCYIQLGKYKGALSDFHSILMLGSLYSDDYFNLVKCYLAIGDYEKTQHYLYELQKFVLEDNIEFKELDTQLEILKLNIENATKFYEDKNYYVTLEHLDYLLEIAHESKQFKLMKAECLVHIGNFAEAYEIIEMYMSSDLLTSDVAYIQALCVYNKDFETALTLLKDVLVVEPNHKKAKYMIERINKFKEIEMIGIHLYNNGNYQEAVNYFNEAMKYYPLFNDLVNLLIKCADVKFKCGLYRDAIDDCTAIITNYKLSREVLRLRGDCYMALRMYEESMDDYQTNLQIDYEYTIQEKFNKANEALKLSQSHYYNHYNVLEVDRTATPEEIREAYKRLLLIHHPDKHSKAPEYEKLQQEEITRQIIVAYDVLEDEVERAAYNLQLNNAF